jgi:hypothetical protein
MIENCVISKRDLQWPSLSSVFNRNVANFKGNQCTFELVLETSGCFSGLPVATLGTRIKTFDSCCITQTQGDAYACRRLVGIKITNNKITK